MNKKIESILYLCTDLAEYEQKQLISCLVALMLTDRSENEAREIYNKFINQLKQEL
tara:strand:- start:189 stop:356 length:168 start_codon:yes stop_codon:yes gene_type:complete